MAKLILLKHGECVWHNENAFTGWADVPLSAKGIIQALKSGSKIAKIEFDMIFTSTQIRAIEAAMVALTENKSKKMPVLVSDCKNIAQWMNSLREPTTENIIPVFRCRDLNEQCELPELNASLRRKNNAAHFNNWCARYNQPLQNNACLQDSAKRTIPFFRNEIIPQLNKNKNILISAHNNTLRVIVMLIENYTQEEICKLAIPTDSPLLYEMKNGKRIRGRLEYAT